VHADSAPLEDANGTPPEDDMEDEYDDTSVSVSFTFVAFTSFAFSFVDLSDYWVDDFACSVNLSLSLSPSPTSPPNAFLNSLL
jgi:hypothetical protein